jgi:DNA-binding NarL/FixJ family response regulator
LLRGLSNKEIASELGRAEPTVKNQVASILRKHRVPSRARLLALHR